MATCLVCEAEYIPGRPCPRCKTDNTPWEAELDRKPRAERFNDFFLNVWGIFALLIPLGALCVFVGFFLYIQLSETPLAGNRAELLSYFLAFFMPFIHTLYFYAVRFSLWEYEWLRQVRKGRWPPLALLGAAAFEGTIVLAILYVFLNIYWETIPPGTESWWVDILQGVFTPLLLSLVIIVLHLAALLMCTVIYIRKLNRRVPQPIYVDRDLLVEVALDSLKEKFRLKDLNLLKVAEVDRTEDGGIKMTVERLKEGSGIQVQGKYAMTVGYSGQKIGVQDILRVAGAERLQGGGYKLDVELLNLKEEETVEMKVEKKYIVLADRRGRLISVKEQQNRRF